MLREENETIINWTAADQKATVYSTMPKIWRWCEKIGGEQIRLNEGIREGKKVARTYRVDPGCIRLRPRRTLSPEQREARRASLQRANEAKSPIPD